MHSDRIFSGVIVEHVDLGRKSTGDALKLLEPVLERFVNRDFTIRAGGESWLYSARELGVSAEVQATVTKAWQIGREGWFWNRWQQRWYLKTRPVKVSPVFFIDEKILRERVQAIEDLIFVEALGASLEITHDHRVEIIPGREGQKLNIEESMKLLRISLQSPVSSGVLLKEEVIHPNPTTEDIEGWQINGVVASFSTNFNAAKESRSSNIRTAAKALDQVLIMNGEFFSFNETVGPRTKERGYRESLIIENSSFTPGLGGGVCQVSTTLYNVALRANLPILERFPHSLPVSYVPPGMDATVAYDWADLKFLNDRKKPLLLHSEYRPGQLKIMLFGTVDDIAQVKIFHRIIRNIPAPREVIEDASLLPGTEVVEEKGQDGMEVEVIREIISGEQVVAREIISRDKYKPQKWIIRTALQL